MSDQVMSRSQLARKLMQDIQCGVIGVGQHLPTMRELASQHGVTLHTVNHALKQLEQLSLVERRPRHGTVVLAKPDSISPSARPLRHVAMLVAGDSAGWTVAPTPEGEWSHRIVRAFEREMFHAGYPVSLLPLSSPGEEAGAGPTLAQRLERMGDSLGGAMALSSDLLLPAMAVLKRYDIPLVSINRPGHGVDHNYIAANNIEAGWRVFRLFRASGVERVMLLASRVSHSLSSGEKMAGFMQGCLEVGLPMERVRVIYIDPRRDARTHSAALVRQAMHEGFTPQGVFTAGDVMAAGAIDAFTSLGLRVPGDVAVMSSTGVVSTGAGDVPLSYVAQPMEALGQAASQMLLEMMREGVRRYQGRRIACPLVLQDSFQLSAAARQTLTQGPDAAWFAQAMQDHAQD